MGGNLDMFWLGGKSYSWGRGLLGLIEGVGDTMIRIAKRNS